MSIGIRVAIDTSCIIKMVISNIAIVDWMCLEKSIVGTFSCKSTTIVGIKVLKYNIIDPSL